jgi:hypothetical protein
MKVRWQDEVKLLYGSMYEPEKERWERKNNRTIGFLDWSEYLSKYAKFRRNEIHLGNSEEIVRARMKKLHPIIWSKGPE